MYLKVGRDAKAVSLYLDGVRQINDGSANFPAAEVDAIVAAREAQAAAKKAAQDAAKAGDAEGVAAAESE